MKPRKIIHLDADCFYAAVEMRDNTQYVGQPIAVGGPADRRGVVATCNYEARAFGVRSAMPTRQALKLCPHLIIIHPDFVRYKAASKQIFGIYQQYTPLVEPLSLDEAYLDVTDSQHHAGSATRIAQEIRQRVLEELGLVVSAGVAPNKFLAKIASDWDKPDGLFVIRPHQIDQFVKDLPVERLFGVGPRTTEKMHKLGLRTCIDLRTKELPFLREQFGKMGLSLHNLSRGIDNRSVTVGGHRKSISVETTFLQDIGSYEDCLPHLQTLHHDLKERVERAQSTELIQKSYVKLRLSDFKVKSIEQNALNVDITQFANLLKVLFAKHSQDIRLLGIGVRLKEPSPSTQLTLIA
jgi:DNA polymerase-4